jgi:hypothetical protein
MPKLIYSKDNKVLDKDGLAVVEGATGPTLWTPAQISTVGWYDASDGDTITLAAGSNICQWDDKSGNGYDLKQLNSSTQPEYVATGINGMPTVYYASTFDIISRTGIPDINCSQVTIVTVGMGKFGDTPALGWVQNTAKTDELFTRIQSNASTGKLWGVLRLDGTSTSINESPISELREEIGVLISMWYDGADLVQRAHGGLDSVTVDVADGATFTINEIHAGRNPSGGNTPRNYHSEFVILDTTDLDTIQKCEGYLAHKWGTDGDLDAGHPYKRCRASL